LTTNFFGGGALGYNGTPLRRFSGVITQRDLEPGQQGRSDRIKLHFAELDVQRAVAKYDYKTCIIDMPAPSERQVIQAHGVPPRSILGVFLKSLDDTFGEGGTSVDQLIKDGIRITLEVTERSRPSRIQNQETGAWEDTGETIEFQEFRVVGTASPVSPLGADADSDASAAGSNGIDPKQWLVDNLVPEAGATQTEIAQAYMSSDIYGRLDDELFNDGLLDKLVAEGVLSIDAEKKYRKVEVA